MLRQVSVEDGQNDDPSYEVAASWAWRNPRGALRLGIAYNTE
jgi:hypothetical protein